MGVRFYDEALLNKLKKWTHNAKVMITGVNETRRLFEISADKTNDQQIQLPLITLSRPGGYTINNRNQRPLAHSGVTFMNNERKGAKVNAIPIAKTMPIVKRRSLLIVRLFMVLPKIRNGIPTFISRADKPAECSLLKSFVFIKI